MADTTQDKINKVRILYERTTNPGEKAAAYEALKRLLGVTSEESPSSANWLEDMKGLLTIKGFYLCCITGNSHLYSNVSEKVRLIPMSFNRGSWEYFEPSIGRKFVFTDRRPDKRGNTRDQLNKVLK